MLKIFVFLFASTVFAKSDEIMECIKNKIDTDSKLLEMNTDDDPSIQVEDDDPEGFLESLYEFNRSLDNQETMEEYLEKNYSVFNFKRWRIAYIKKMLTREINEMVEGNVVFDTLKTNENDQFLKSSIFKNENLDFVINTRHCDVGYLKFHNIFLDVNFKANPLSLVKSQSDEAIANTQVDLTKQRQYFSDVIGFFQSSLTVKNLSDKYNLDDFLRSKSFNLVPNAVNLYKHFISLDMHGFDYIIAKIFTYCNSSIKNTTALPLYQNRTYFITKLMKKEIHIDCYNKLTEAYANTSIFNGKPEKEKFMEDSYNILKAMNKKLRNLYQIKIRSNRKIVLNDLLNCAIKPNRVLNESLINWYEYVMIPACSHVAAKNTYTSLGALNHFAVNYSHPPHPHLCLSLIESFNENKNIFTNILDDLNTNYMTKFNSKRKRFVFITLFSDHLLRTLKSINVKACVISHKKVADINFIDKIKSYLSEFGPLVEYYWELQTASVTVLKTIKSIDILKKKDKTNSELRTYHSNKKRIKELIKMRQFYKNLNKEDKLKALLNSKLKNLKNFNNYSYNYNKLDTIAKFEKTYKKDRKSKVTGQNLRASIEYYKIMTEKFTIMKKHFLSAECPENKIYLCIAQKTRKFLDELSNKLMKVMIDVSESEISGVVDSE